MRDPTGGGDISWTLSASPHGLAYIVNDGSVTLREDQDLVWLEEIPGQVNFLTRPCPYVETAEFGRAIIARWSTQSPQSVDTACHGTI